MKFIHAADLHLDSPLHGLVRYEGVPAAEMRDATRRALENLVAFATAEPVDFLLIAGDVYDGDWRDYSTGLFFARKMTRLRDAGIRVFLIKGNHDAASVITRELRLPENVFVFSAQGAQTALLHELGVAIHGQSYGSAAVTQDLAAEYPSAVAGFFNIGLLHTSVEGRPGHERYAPCSYAGLRSKGYDYWALGHVHEREVLGRDPWVVFPGNLQGRNIRETGSKGCLLVTVEDRHVVSANHVAVDAARWLRQAVDLQGAESPQDVLTRVESALQDAIGRAEGRILAVRLVLEGVCGAHRELVLRAEHWESQLRMTANDVGSGQLWLEKVRLETRPLASASDPAARQDGVAELTAYLDQLATDEVELGSYLDTFKDLRMKLPAELRADLDAFNLEDVSSLRAILPASRDLLLSRLGETAAE